MGEYDLYHADRKRHKYIKKIGNRYFYTQQEIQAYLDKKKGQVEYTKEAVAEATGRRDVYWEAPQVKENGHTFYDDEASVLRTGKKDKHGVVTKEGYVRTTRDGKKYEQYDNEYTREVNEKTRKRGRKKLKNMATKPIRSVKKQAAKGKKAVSKFYKNNINPGVTVTYDEAKIH